MDNNKKTVVLGASTNPSRYSYIATKRLIDAGHDVLPIGIKKGSIHGLEILNDYNKQEDVNTITLYMNPKRQEPLYDYILSLNPKRIIFNPGTENPKLMALAKEQGIEVVVACTLVMLAIGDY